jgi:DNA-directed RNA polymerase specialized sigma24 family protein
MSADDPGSITRWLDGLKSGEPDAADAIWRRYYQRVVAVARRRLQAGPHQAVEDGEDVALSAFQVLYAGAARGQFDRLRDRTELWKLLAAIAAKKVLQHRRWHGRLKRGGQVDRASAPYQEHGDADAEADVLALIADNAPTPDVALILRERLQELLDALPDAIHRRIAEWHIEGVSNTLIARDLGCAVRTVERKIENVRLIWEQICEESEP